MYLCVSIQRKQRNLYVVGVVINNESDIAGSYWLKDCDPLLNFHRSLSEEKPKYCTMWIIYGLYCTSYGWMPWVGLVNRVRYGGEGGNPPWD